MKIKKIEIVILILLSFLFQFAHAQEEGKIEKEESAAESIEDVQLESTEAKRSDLFKFYKSERKKKYSADSKDRTSAKQKNLDAVVNEMQVLDAASFEYNLSAYDNSNFDPDKYPNLEYAYSLQPENIETYTLFVAHGEIVQDENIKKEFCTKLKNAGVYSPAEMTYNKNVLFSLDDNSYLITNGEVDTYPSWIQQEVNGLRKNIQIINLELLQNLEYRNRIFKEMGIPEGQKVMTSKQIVAYILGYKNNGQVYLALTLNKDILRDFSSSLWLTGMALKYDLSPSYDYMDSLSSNWETYFAKEHITTADQINRNYILILKKLSIYYNEIGDNKKEKEVNKLMQTICDNFGIDNPLK